MQPPIEKKFNILALVVISLLLARPLPAVPITGTFDFGGTARLDGPTVDTSTEVKTWESGKVTAAGGSFSGVNGLSVNLTAPWAFYSGTFNDFLDVGGFQFNLTSSSIFDDYAGVLTVVLAGNVTGNSYDQTSFIGRLKIQDPDTPGGDFKYTSSLLLPTVPDGGTTALLLGLALCGLVLLRRKLPI